MKPFTYFLPVVAYQASLLGMPDLPSWIQLSYAPAINTGFLFGVPPPHQQTTKAGLPSTYVI